MRRVIIMRGLSGAGKSYEAELIRRGTASARIVSADNYFILNGGGEYLFDAAKLGDAHIACMRDFLDSVQRGIETVIVDNTNVRLFEVNPYRLVGLAHAYTVEVVRVICDMDICVKRNTHNVSPATIRAMWEKFEDMPAFLGGERIIHHEVK